MQFNINNNSNKKYRFNVQLRSSAYRADKMGRSIRRLFFFVKYDFTIPMQLVGFNGQSTLALFTDIYFMY